jgi:group I intron endonuclease
MQPEIQPKGLMDTRGKFLVYLVICRVNNLPYVGVIYGKSQTVIHRWHEHCNPVPSKQHFRLETAIREHGIDNFTIEVLDKADTRALLMSKERFYIRLYDSYYNGYNGSLGGGVFPIVFSAEHRRNMSIARRGKNRGNTSGLGYKHTAQAKRKISEALRNRPPISDETRAKLRKGQANRHPISDETRLKMREAARGNKRCFGRIISESTRLKMAAAKLGTHRSEETKRKIGQSQLGRKCPYMVANKIWLGRKHTDEARRKMSEAQKARYAAIAT